MSDAGTRSDGRRGAGADAIEAIVCDFGGVLTTPLVGAFAAIVESHGIPLTALGAAMGRLAQQRGEQPLYELERGEIEEAEFVGLVERALEPDLGRRPSLANLRSAYFEHLDPNAEMIARMRELGDRGYRMAILTNNVREWEPLWRGMLPVDEIFELVIDSAFVGMRKPERRIYELTLQRLGVEAERALFVDDLDVNCDAAREVGMRVVRFEDNAQAIAEIDAALGDQLGEPSRSQQ